MPASPPSATPGPATPTSARFTITVPNHGASSASARKPKYVSPATQSIVITLLTVNGTAYTGSPREVASNLTSTNPNCSGSPLTCTVTAPAVAGSDVFQVVTYDAQQTTPTPSTPAGNALSGADVTLTMIAGQANADPTPLILDGVVDHVVLALSPTAETAGTPGTVGVSVEAYDKDDNLLVGPGNYADANGDALTIHLSDSDTSGHTMLSTTSLTAPTSGITLSYDGATIAAPTISAGVSGGTIAGGAPSPATLSVNPTLTSLSSPAYLPGQTVTETLTGVGFIAGATSVQLSGSGVTAGTANVTSSTSLTVDFTVAAGAAAGAQNVMVTTSGGTSGPQPFTVASGYVVTSTADDGSAGTLRAAIDGANAASGELIAFNCGTPCTITLGSALPPITSTVSIDGDVYGDVVIDGANAYRAFWADSGTVFLHALEIQNTRAQGGTGGAGYPEGGGGGLGAGAGLFIRTANVTVSSVYFNNSTAIGGTGGAGISSAEAGGGGGGGGGLGGNGGEAGTYTIGDGGGGGGGGVTGTGGNGTSAATGGLGGAGGTGGGGGGGCAALSCGEPGGAGYAGGAPGASAPNGAGGVGGFGGGGGGGSDGEFGAAGGFGGGGGAGGSLTTGSAAGGAGGGGAADFGQHQPGGSLGAGVTGGMGADGARTTDVVGGGGGAAAGPAIFVYAGTLTTTGSGSADNAAVGGAAGSGAANGATAGGADATAVFNYGGTVNGSTTTGPIAAALGNNPPASVLRRR
ncbi:MAG TPA: hypothetical protein VMD91_04170 [Candidatus Sulfotelmatobacter sp.]|nr:hypothetical protein [Candidatus Sulfotelmatobacter sp.]